MSIDLTVLGRPSEPALVTWTSSDALLYALGVGAGRDPSAELAFTTENSAQVEQQVLPAFGVVLAMSRGPRAVLGNYPRSAVLHADQAFEVHAPLPPEGEVHATTTCVDLFDKGSAALARTSTTLSDPATGAALFTSTTGLFIRGEGGFGGAPGPRPTWQLPGGTPDALATAEVRPDQALLYRLCGDRNPLHSDPEAARQGGFERPILHGLCTYGIASRLLLNTHTSGEAGRVRAMSGRFTRPVLPGAWLTVRSWQVDEGHALFQVLDDTDAVVIDHGEFRWA